MFSANQNIALREHKRRVVSFVESTIPEDALEMGTMVMGMEVSCKSPGCVPLETVITIVFPRGQTKELIPGLPESGRGGNFKTKILMPLAEVTKDDVLDALPPEFEGGRRTMESLCLRARDVMIGQIGQIMGEEDLEGRKLIAEYLMSSLKEYVARDCVAPEIGEAFAPLADDTSGSSPAATSGTASKNGTSIAPSLPATGNFIVRRKNDDDGPDAGQTPMPTGSTETKDNESSSTANHSQSAGNFVVHRGENSDTNATNATSR